MARERKKPEGSFIERAKNEIENEDTLLTNRAYELGRIRGWKEAIEKAKEWVEKESASSMAEENGKDFIEYMVEE